MAALLSSDDTLLSSHLCSERSLESCRQTIALPKSYAFYRPEVAVDPIALRPKVSQRYDLVKWIEQPVTFGFRDAHPANKVPGFQPVLMQL